MSAETKDHVRAAQTRLVWVVLLLSALGGWSTSAAAITADRIDLGPAPISGAEAFGSIDIRADAVVKHLACGREFEFHQVADTGDPFPKNFMGDVWPVLIGKVQHLVKFPGQSCRATVPYGDWDGTSFTLPFTNARWGRSIDDNGRSEILNGINERLKNRVSGFSQNDCDNAATEIVIPNEDEVGKPALIEFELTPGCLRAQINAVLATRDRFGSNPGSAGLPCFLVGKPTEGDWDMAVSKLTRLVHLARGDRSLFDARTVRKLEQLLTLSGPLLGESYGLYQCGNPDNTVGSAQERADEADFYDDGFFSDVGDLLEWLAAFLAIILIVVAAAITAAAAANVITGGLATFGALLAGAAVGAVASLPIMFIRIEETENHLLMINTSKYLMNQMIIEQLPDDDDKETFREYNEDIRDWLLDRFQDIVKMDFDEYNSRPYQSLSLGAILNIHDFAIDPRDAADTRLKTAAASVLDLAAAKMALGSSMGRRIVPFRRLAGANDLLTRYPPQPLFQLIDNADQMIAAMLLWAGQVQHSGQRLASLGAAGSLAFEATSTYKPHELILAIAIEKDTPYEQWIRHAGWEHYSSGPGWLLTAGGTSTEHAQLALIAPVEIEFMSPFGLKDENRGAGVPTTLIPHAAAQRQDTLPDFLRFEGLVQTWTKDKPDDPQPLSFDGNFCLDRGFACGIRMIIPEAVAPCLDTFEGVPDNLFFIDSAACGPWSDAPRFFVVVYRQSCSADYIPCGGGLWGFIEVVEPAPGQTLEVFATETVQRNAGRFSSWSAASTNDGIDSLAYVSWRSGTILFDPDLYEDDSNSTGIIALDDSPGGHRSELELWDRAGGDILIYTGEARATIGRPGDPRKIEIDFTDVEDPKRVLPP